MNKEEKREYDRQYRILHKDEIREKDKKRDANRKEYKAKHHKDYRDSHKEELRTKKKQYYEENKESIRTKGKEYYEKHKLKFKERNMKNWYGISLDEYNNLLEKQKGLCAICGKPERAKRNGILKRLAVDHDHKTGKVRKLLCTSCNTAIGKVNEDISILTNMIEYLKTFV